MEPSPSRKLCWDADYFAASVLMQPAVFAPFAKASGLDIIALRSQFECSYASVNLRLAEVMRNQPLLGVLYQRQEQGNPTEWTEPPDRRQFRATIVTRTPGFGIRDPRVLCGSRGGMPRKGTTPSPGSIAEWVVLNGEGVLITVTYSREYETNEVVIRARQDREEAIQRLESIVRRLAACYSDSETQIQFLPLIDAAREYVMRVRQDRDEAIQRLESE